MSTIWIIGGGIESIPGLLKVREKGHHIVVSDGSPAAPGFRLADESFVVDTYNAEQTVEAAVSYNLQNPLHGVMAMGSDVPETVAAVAEALDLPGPGLEAARLFGDKLTMKERFLKHGIPSPWFQAVDSPREVEKIIRERDRIMVLKPADSRGARGVIRMTPDIDAAWAFAQSQNYSPTRRVMIEDWVEGQQISTESILCGGRVVTPGLADRNYEWLERFRPYVIEDGGDLPARLSLTERAELDDLILGLAEAFEIDHWTLKGDVVWTSKGPLIIEAALRLSGGYFCSHTAPLCSGVDVVSAAIRLALGEALEWDRL
ncbi:MAG: ATP-grasp domain-containing protein, partial [Deltaproteobacteria bacterium]|nr:ATP-grasp domain-containing protein [Deltaproteobacteria bacterium]